MLQNGPQMAAKRGSKTPLFGPESRLGSGLVWDAFLSPQKVDFGTPFGTLFGSIFGHFSHPFADWGPTSQRAIDFLAHLAPQAPSRPPWGAPRERPRGPRASQDPQNVDFDAPLGPKTLQKPTDF